MHFLPWSRSIAFVWSVQWSPYIYIFLKYMWTIISWYFISTLVLCRHIAKKCLQGAILILGFWPWSNDLVFPWFRIFILFLNYKAILSFNDLLLFYFALEYSHYPPLNNTIRQSLLIFAFWRSGCTATYPTRSMAPHPYAVQ